MGDYRPWLPRLLELRLVCRIPLQLPASANELVNALLREVGDRRDPTHNRFGAAREAFRAPVGVGAEEDWLGRVARATGEGLYQYFAADDEAVVIWRTGRPFRDTIHVMPPEVGQDGLGSVMLYRRGPRAADADGSDGDDRLVFGMHIENDELVVSRAGLLMGQRPVEIDPRVNQTVRARGWKQVVTHHANLDRGAEQRRNNGIMTRARDAVEAQLRTVLGRLRNDPLVVWRDEAGRQIDPITTDSLAVQSLVVTIAIMTGRLGEMMDGVQRAVLVVPLKYRMGLRRLYTALENEQRANELFLPGVRLPKLVKADLGRDNTTTIDVWCVFRDDRVVSLTGWTGRCGCSPSDPLTSREGGSDLPTPPGPTPPHPSPLTTRHYIAHPSPGLGGC